MHKEKGHEHKATSKATLEEQTIHSLVELQKVHINLAEKFDKLTTQIENLLALFELAARNLQIKSWRNKQQEKIGPSLRSPNALEKLEKTSTLQPRQRFPS